MQLSRFTIHLLALGLCSISANVTAISFRPEHSTSKNAELRASSYRLSGQIYVGDVEIIKREIIAHPERFLGPMPISLNSPGGNIEEAMKIATLFEAMGAFVQVNEGNTCASACALIFMTAPVRQNLGTVLLHRPYFDADAVGDMSSITAMRALREGVAQTSVFLEESGVPARLTEAMAKTSSTQSYQITYEDELELGMLSPSMEEIAIAKCRPAIPKGYSLLMGCAGMATKDLSTEVVGKLIGKSSLNRVARQALIEEGGVEREDGSISMPRDFAGASPTSKGSESTSYQFAIHEDQEMASSVFTPEQSDATFLPWKEIAERSGMQASDPINPMRRAEYLINKLLPALARNGNHHAMLALGKFGVKFKSKDARFWLQMAAEHGNAEAPLLLASTYEGAIGGKVDLVRAYAWVILARSTEPEASLKVANRLKLTLTAAQLTEAEALATRLATKL